MVDFLSIILQQHLLLQLSSPLELLLLAATYRRSQMVNAMENVIWEKYHCSKAVTLMIALKKYIINIQMLHEPIHPCAFLQRY